MDLKMFRYLSILILFISICNGTDLYPEEKHQLSGSTTPEIRDSLEGKGVQKTCSVTMETVNQYILRNDISALVDLYHQVIENPIQWFSENLQDTACFSPKYSNRLYMMRFKTDQEKNQNIALFFYPDKYIKQHYGRSFDKLNEAAKLCVLIAAVNGHHISREMIANGFPFQERDNDYQEKLRFSRQLSTSERPRYVLETPFSLNYSPNVAGFDTEEGAKFIDGILQNTSTYDPIIIMNAGYVRFSQSRFDEAYQLFMCAGDKRIVAGYIEAAGIILRSKKNDGISISEIQYYKNEITAAAKIEEILGMAGVRGKWELATYYRFGNIKNYEDVNYIKSYFDIVKSNLLEPYYYCGFGELSLQTGKQNLDKIKKIQAYKTALNCFLKAIEFGMHSFYTKIQEVSRLLIPLIENEDEKSKINHKIDTVVESHVKILRDLRNVETVLINHLISE